MGNNSSVKCPLIYTSLTCFSASINVGQYNWPSFGSRNFKRCSLLPKFKVELKHFIASLFKKKKRKSLVYGTAAGLRLSISRKRSHEQPKNVFLSRVEENFCLFKTN